MPEIFFLKQSRTQIQILISFVQQFIFIFTRLDNSPMLFAMTIQKSLFKEKLHLVISLFLKDLGQINNLKRNDNFYTVFYRTDIVRQCDIRAK